MIKAGRLWLRILNFFSKKKTPRAFPYLRCGSDAAPGLGRDMLVERQAKPDSHVLVHKDQDMGLAVLAVVIETKTSGGLDVHLNNHFRHALHDKPPLSLS
jgi:hypothetical protein